MRKRSLLLNFFIYVVFAVYIAILLQVLLFGRVRLLHLFDSGRPVWRSVNIMPFDSILNYISGSDIIADNFAFSNVFGNIALFIPMGIYLPLIRRNKKIPVNILLIFAMSLSVEVIQYIFGIGISDIDDIILNCAGGFIGIALFRLLLSITKDMDKARLIIAIIAPIGGLALVFLFNNMHFLL